VQRTELDAAVAEWRTTRTLLKRAFMAHSHFDRFLEEATYRDRECDSTLDKDVFYGLYTSWCYVTQNAPQAERTFWAAMKERVGSGRNGLQMKGPAAADYILNSYQAVV
jgi:hypothetical protein